MIDETELIKQLKEIIQDYELLYGLKRIVNDVIDKNGCTHGKDGKFKSDKQIETDIQCSFLEQILTMIDLDISWDEFSQIVHQVNNKYHSKINKFNKKETIIHFYGNYLYKMKNKGFNNYLFYGKISVDKLKEMKLKEWIKQNDLNIY